MRKTRIRTMHDLASVARGRRIELGLTQAELASRSGVSRDWVNSFERGKRTVELSLVFRLFDALGIGVEAMDATAIGGAQAGAPSLDALLSVRSKGVVNHHVGCLLVSREFIHCQLIVEGRLPQANRQGT